MEPTIQLQFSSRQRLYNPRADLRVEYSVQSESATEVQAIEESVLWHTEGKGDEDLAVHYFERRVRGDYSDRDLRRNYQLETILPNSPLTYDGAIVKIRWCVRIRVFLGGGDEIHRELRFQLSSDSGRRNGSTSGQRTQQVHSA